MLLVMSHAGFGKKFAQSYYVDLLYEVICIFAISIFLISVAKCKLIFVLNLWLCSCYS
jgi:hypothetical protein